MRIAAPVLLLPLLYLTGCVVPNSYVHGNVSNPISYEPYYYEVTLVAVERPSDAADRYSEPIRVEPADEGLSRYVYADSLLSIGWVPDGSRFHFVLTNRSRHTLRLDWNEAAFVGPDGAVSRVMHEGVRYSERETAAMPPSVIPRGGTLTDVVLPNVNVSYSQGSGWRAAPLLRPVLVYEGTVEEALDNVGKEMRILLPIAVEGVVNEYTFVFRVTTASPPAGYVQPEAVPKPGVDTTGVGR